MIERKKIMSLLNVVEKTIALLERNLGDTELYDKCVKTIIKTQHRVNKELFSTEHFSEMCLNLDELRWAEDNKELFLERVFLWFQFVVETIEGYEQKRTYLDSEFYCLCRYLEVSDKESLVKDWKLNFGMIDETLKQTIMEWYDKYDYLWGVIHPEENRYDIIESRISVWKEHEKDFIWLYERLADYRSKVMLYRVLRNWITFDNMELRLTKEMCFEDYFDLDLFKSNKQEVFVDCGAYLGDSAMGFIESFREYKKVYCYEATQKTFEILCNNMSDYENVICKHLAVGKEYGKIMLSDDADASSIYGKGQQEVDMVTIDEDIIEPISVIKMDIEGAEQDALIGAKRHILTDYPKLLICVYHGNRDLIEIPMLIESIRDDYDFYFRYNGNLFAPTEMVLFAIPRDERD